MKYWIEAAARTRLWSVALSFLAVALITIEIYRLAMKQ